MLEFSTSFNANELAPETRNRAFSFVRNCPIVAGARANDESQQINQIFMLNSRSPERIAKRWNIARKRQGEETFGTLGIAISFCLYLSVFKRGITQGS